MTLKALIKRNTDSNYLNKLSNRKAKIVKITKYKAFDKIMKSIQSSEFIHYQACMNLIDNFIKSYPSSDGGYLLIKQLNYKFNIK